MNVDQYRAIRVSYENFRPYIGFRVALIEVLARASAEKGREPVDAIAHRMDRD